MERDSLLLTYYTDWIIVVGMRKEKMDKLKMLELATHCGEQESHRTWKRMNVMLTFNAALIALVSLTDKTNLPFAVPISSLFGLILCAIWYKLVQVSKYYEERWHLDMKEIIDSDADLKKYFRARSKDGARNNPRPTKRTATGYMKCLVLVVALLWLVILVGSMYANISSNTIDFNNTEHTDRNFVALHSRR